MQDIATTGLQLYSQYKEAGHLQLKAITDGIGRTLAIGASGGAQFFGTAAARWLGTGPDHLTAAGYTSHGVAFSIVSYILNTAAPIPWAVYTLDGHDNRAKPVAPNHPLALLLYRPNPRQSWAEFKMQVEGCYEVKGEAFIRRIRPAAGSRKGKTTELWCLVGRVDVLPLTGLNEYDAPAGYRHYDALTGAITDYPADDILHLKTWNPDNPHRGLSPVQAGIDAITASKATLEARVRQYQNQGPPGIIYDDAETAGDWTPDQVGGIRAYLRSFFVGGRREAQIPVLAHKLGYLRLGLSAVDMDVLAAIPYDKDSVADLWRFPGQLLNGSKGTTFNNMSEASKALYTRCVLPLESVVRDGINRWLGPEYEDAAYIDFDTSHIPELQEDKAKQAELLGASWWIPVQEKQRLSGQVVDTATFGEKPVYLIPATLMPYDPTAAGVPADAAASAGDVMN